MERISKTVYIAAIIESVFFGLTFLGAKIALRELDAIEVLACRWTLAMVLFAILALCRVIKIDYRKKPLWMVAGMAFIQPCINTICETCGIDLTTTSESAIMYAMIPMTVALISTVALKHKMTLKTAGGIILSFIGVLVAIVFSDGFSIGGKAAGYLILLGMVLTGAVFTIVSGRISDRFTAMERTFAMAALGAVWFNSLNLVRGKGFECYRSCFEEPDIGLAILFLGAIGSFTCYILFNFVVSKMPAPQASTLQVNIITLTGVLSGIVFQGDSFGWYTVAGVAMILLGVIASNADSSEPEETVSRP